MRTDFWAAYGIAFLYLGYCQMIQFYYQRGVSVQKLGYEDFLADILFLEIKVMLINVMCKFEKITGFSSVIFALKTFLPY